MTYYEWEKKGLSAIKEFCIARESICFQRVLDLYEAKPAKDAARSTKKNRDEAGGC
jgi:hypothetical protein